MIGCLDFWGLHFWISIEYFRFLESCPLHVHSTQLHFNNRAQLTRSRAFYLSQDAHCKFLFLYICCIFLIFLSFAFLRISYSLFSFQNSYTPVARFFPAIYVLKAPWARQLLRRATHPFFPQSIRSAPLPNHRQVRRPCTVDPGIA